MEQVLRITGDRDAYFWATHGGAELDLLVEGSWGRFDFEFKYGDAPVMTKSMHVVLADLKLDRLFVVHPGRDSYAMQDRTEAVGIQDLRDRLEKEGI